MINIAQNNVITIYKLKNNYNVKTKKIILELQKNVNIMFMIKLYNQTNAQNNANKDTIFIITNVQQNVKKTNFIVKIKQNVQIIV